MMPYRDSDSFKLRPHYPFKKRSRMSTDTGGFVVPFEEFLGAFAELRIVAISFAVSVHPYAWNISAPTIRIVLEFGT